MGSSPLVVVVVVFVASILFSSSSSSVVSAVMSEENPSPLAESLAGRKGGDESAAAYIVLVHCPEGVQPQDFHIDTLAAVLGSKEAARAALIHHYTHAASGFAAKLTGKQVEELRKQPGVLKVLPDRILHPLGRGAGVF